VPLLAGAQIPWLGVLPLVFQKYGAAGTHSNTSQVDYGIISLATMHRAQYLPYLGRRVASGQCGGTLGLVLEGDGL